MPKCSLCNNEAAWCYETEGRGWSFRCAECYSYSTPLLRSFMEEVLPNNCYCEGPCTEGFFEV